MTLLEHMAAHTRTLPVALARCMTFANPKQQARLALLNKLFAALPPEDQVRSRDAYLELVTQLADARAAAPAIRAALESLK